MVNVFITVDTEISPRTRDWRAEDFPRHYRRDIEGATARGDFGVAHQINVLDEYGLKGVFFVEPLFADVVGPEPLRRIVDLVQSRGHEVQLHLHTEWLAHMPADRSPLPGRTGNDIKDFSEDEQTVLLARGLENLRACGARNVTAFRAGNYGANFATLRALARNGIRYDTSHNTCYLDSACDMRTDDECFQHPRKIEGVYEFPITYFHDWPGHRRHAQLCACSAAEMEAALMAAWRAGRYAFVLVSHSFELIRRPRSLGPARPDPVVARRFIRLCRFLADNRDKFVTRGFNDIDPASIPPGPASAEPLHSSVFRTAGRAAGQLVRRVL